MDEAQDIKLSLLPYANPPGISSKQLAPSRPPSPSRTRSPSQASSRSFSPTPLPLPSVRKGPTLRYRFRALLTNFGLKILSASNTVLHSSGAKEERRKVALRRDFLTALARCIVHILPVCTTFVLAWLNIRGFYIGADLEGGQWQYAFDTKILALQGTAKIFELLVVASTATTVVDVIRTYLVRDADGVPLGLLSAHLEFADLSYFWSPQFWYGLKGLVSPRDRWLVGGYLLCCGILALAAGPASALLLLPQEFSAWPAGATKFYLAGNESYNFPLTLTNDSMLSDCLAPGPGTLKAELISQVGCAWEGYQGLQQAFRSSHQVFLDNITITDGTSTRVLQQFANTASEPFTLAPNVGATSPSFDIGKAWTSAIEALGGTSSYAHYKRLGPGTVFRIPSYMPLVRTKCNYLEFPPENGSSWKYPYLPQFGPSKDGFDYVLPAGHFYNASHITAQWRAPPQGLTRVIGVAETPYYPSTFLDLQIPWGGSFAEFGGIYTCSVDARWVMSDNVGVDFDTLNPGRYYVYADFPIEYGLGPPPAKFPYFKKSLPPDGAIDLSLDWLNNLTPSVDDTLDAYTTLSDIFKADRLDINTTDQVPRINNTENTIATVVADGLSRVSYSLNGGNFTLAGDHYLVFDRYNASSTNFAEQVYRGTASLPPPTNYPISNSTQLVWNAYIRGYGYRATGSAASWIALAVLFAHAALATAHTIWRLSRATSSEAWNGTTEMLVLAQQSRPSERLKSTCTGVDRGETLAQRARIRVVPPRKGRTGEQVQLLFDDAAELGRAEMLRENVAYGSW